jgi:hypothetical protein
MQTRAEVETADAAMAGWMKYLYAGLLGLMALTGFGQMPIYKRYYLSDIPGLGWLADFWVTRYVHYAGAALLLALAAWALADFFIFRRGRLRVSGPGALRGGLLAGLAASGALIVFKNFPHAHLPDGLVIGLNLFHIGAATCLVLFSLACLALKKKWTVPGSASAAKRPRGGG